MKNVNDYFKLETNLAGLYEFKNFKKLHCTSKFYGQNKEVDNYIKNPNVSLNIGKVFLLKIIGFSITSRTFCVYLNLFIFLV